MTSILGQLCPPGMDERLWDLVRRMMPILDAQDDADYIRQVEFIWQHIGGRYTGQRNAQTTGAPSRKRQAQTRGVYANKRQSGEAGAIHKMVDHTAIDDQMVNSTSSKSARQLKLLVVQSLQQGGVTEKQLQTSTSLLRRLLSIEAVNDIRLLVLAYRHDQQWTTESRKRGVRRCDIRVDEFHDFFAAYSTIQVAETKGAVQSIDLLTKYRQLDLDYQTLLHRMRVSQQARRAIQSGVQRFRESIVRGATLSDTPITAVFSSCSDANDAQTMLILKQWEGEHRSRQGSQVISEVQLKEARTMLQYRLRIASSLAALTNALSRGVWALLVGWRWRTVLASINQRYISAMTTAMRRYDPGFDRMFASLDLNLITPMAAEQPLPRRFNFESYTNEAQIERSRAAGMEFLLGVSSEEDVFIKREWQEDDEMGIECDGSTHETISSSIDSYDQFPGDFGCAVETSDYEET